MNLPHRNLAYLPERDGPFVTCHECHDTGYVPVVTARHFPLSMQGTRCREAHTQPWEAMAPCVACSLGLAIARGIRADLEAARAHRAGKRLPPNRRMMLTEPEEP